MVRILGMRARVVWADRLDKIGVDGYGDYARVDEQFVFKIPDGLPSEIAAPMMWAGITMYSALK